MSIMHSVRLFDSDVLEKRWYDYQQWFKPTNSFLSRTGNLDNRYKRFLERCPGTKPREALGIFLRRRAYSLALHKRRIHHR